MISYDEFKNTELKIADVLSAERVEGSEKLLKLQIRIGGEERQLVAGIGKAYEPESLIGRQIVVVANLAPRSLMGLESQGMLLAADGVDGPVLLTPDKQVISGVIIK
ncbi:MAG: methionine--tRNA ligase subunit beta [Patescibacteria group bacterium]